MDRVAGGRAQLAVLAGAGVPGADEVRAQALEVARGWWPPGAPRSWRLTAALFEAIATHDDLLDRLAVLPADRLPALLGSAAIAFLVRRDRPVPLAGYFPNSARPSRGLTKGSSWRSGRSARRAWMTLPSCARAAGTR
jgi:hypothetical protein